MVHAGRWTGCHGPQVRFEDRAMSMRCCDETLQSARAMGSVPHLRILTKSLVHVRVLWCAGEMYGLILSARRETTKTTKGQILDRLVAEAGWSRANARRRLGKVFKRRGPARAVARNPRRRESTKVLVK